jgi:SHOCT-like protein
VADALERVLQLVAEGRLTAEEAAPLLDALDAANAAGPAAGTAGGTAEPAPDAPASAVRIEVSDGGRKVINLRVPLALGRSAISGVPGLTEATTERIKEAIQAGIKGPILDVDDDDGSGVRVVIE